MTRFGLPLRGRDAGFVWRTWIGGLLVAIAATLSATTFASAETRTLKLYYIHTGEKAEITFKRDGKYVQSGLKQLNHFLRDWRRNEPTKMDPRLFDVVWQVYKNVGASGYIHVVSAYRSPATNSMLRKRGRGVAEKSQHMLGKAMDFFIPGVKLRDIRYAGLRLQGGGVGFYPTSGSPFVHLDVGNVRHWPKMSRSELASVFPNGKTMHVPSDGKPLPGYDQAVAAYGKRKNTAVAYASDDTPAKKRNFLATLFGGGADEEEDNAPSPPPVAKAPVAVASAPAAVAAAPEPEAIAAVEPPEDTQTIIAALPLRDVPPPMFAPRPSAEVGATAVASLAPEVEPATPPSAEVVAAAAQDLAVGEAEEAIAEDVPVPMPRPAFAQPATAIAAAATETPAVAAIASEETVTEGEAALVTALAASSRPTDLDGIPVPLDRPDSPVVLAALAPVPAARPAIAAIETTAGVRPATPRDALMGSEGDPVAAVKAGPTTTSKSARPSAVDAKPEPRPVQVSIKSGIVNRAFANTLLMPRPAQPDGKAFAVNSLRQAPSEVYTAGFQQVARAPDAKRFTGKAVTFMSVAKFSTN